jgi:hypothetical protein
MDHRIVKKSETKLIIQCAGLETITFPYRKPFVNECVRNSMRGQRIWLLGCVDDDASTCLVQAEAGETDTDSLLVLRKVTEPSAISLRLGYQ